MADTLLFGYVILNETLLTKILSVTLTPISIAVPVPNELSFIGVAFNILGRVGSVTVKLMIVILLLPLVSFAKKVTLYVPIEEVGIMYEIL